MATYGMSIYPIFCDMPLIYFEVKIKSQWQVFQISSPHVCQCNFWTALLLNEFIKNMEPMLSLSVVSTVFLSLRSLTSSKTQSSSEWKKSGWAQTLIKQSTFIRIVNVYGITIHLTNFIIWQFYFFCRDGRCFLLFAPFLWCINTRSHKTAGNPICPTWYV